YSTEPIFEMEEEEMRTPPKKAPIVELDSEGNEYLRREEDDDTFSIEMVDTIFRHILTLLTIIQANFDPQRSCGQLFFPIIIMIFSLGVSIYFMAYIVYQLLDQPIDVNNVSSQLLLLTWILQAGVSTICVINWQRTGMWKHFLKCLYEPLKGKGITNGRRELRRIVIHFYITSIVIVLYCSSYAILGQLEWIDVPHSLRALYYPRLQILIQLANLYLFLCWNLALFVYVFFTHSLYFEIREYNQFIAKLHEEESQPLTDKIESAIAIHIMNAKTVRALDDIFKRYAFMMLSTNLPTTLFAFFLLFSRRHEPWPEIAMTLPVILFCVVGFLSLTAAPAKLHDALYDTRAIFCSNRYVWLPFRTEVYQAAVALCCHLDQANLGISIWGFAVVSRPLILTTFSVMATFLALLLQFNDCRALATPPPPFNLTHSTAIS
ncbi:hypothetical protein PENTCL1PPCAC_17538, partial [Pristionchus entomophagus]